ncbi:MAG: hypothetical protein H0W12_11950 [Chitinophagaceae bacterium]|nr:hypothetical protein [Chitinophagaceae bacterium]
MKPLNFILGIFIFSCIFISCEKEYSLEGNNSLTAGTWQFTENGVLFSGTIDSATIDTFGFTKVLNLAGKSVNGQQNFLLQLFTVDSFKTGSYPDSLSESEFNYSANSKTIYQADQLTGGFITNLNSITNNKLSGTFSGLVSDSNNNIKQITAGLFSCSINLKSNAVTSSGNLGSSAGTCSPVTVSGSYTAGVPLTPVNTVQVQVNVTSPGAYSIFTNTVNGVSFSKSGTFISTGVRNVTLAGSGTPVASGSQNFTITYGTGNCNFSISF